MIEILILMEKMDVLKLGEKHNKDLEKLRNMFEFQRVIK